MKIPIFVNAVAARSTSPGPHVQQHGHPGKRRYLVLRK
jgi:hypothetical protein